MPGFEPLPAQVDLPALEQEILARWQDAGIFERSLKQTEGGPAWIFYEGPPTANGPPASHHLRWLASANGLLDIPEDVVEVSAGTQLQVWDLS